ncbi:MAG: MFS transporter [Acidobacteria bacterium]|nr:MFS transporter [Acidobacteriota bacterium]
MKLSPAGLVVVLWCALALNYIDRQIPYSIFPALRHDLGFAGWQLGLIGGVFLWIYALSMPIAGRLADLWPKHYMVAASVLLWSAGTLGCSLAGSVTVFLLWRAWLAITEAIYFPAAAAMLAAVHQGASRSKALGIHQSAQFFGLFAGGWYGGFMADHHGWRTGFAAVAILGILYAPLLYWSLPRLRTTASPIETGAWPDLLHSRQFLALCAAFFFFCAMLWIFYAWYPAFLQERYKMSMTESGWNATLFVQSSCAIGVLCGGALADRLSRRHKAARFYVAAAGIILSSPFGYLTFSTHSLTMARTCSALYGALAGLMIANVFASAFDVIDRRNYGMAAGVLNMVGGVSSGTMIFLAGLYKESLGFPAMMAAVGALCILSAVMVIRAASRLPSAWHQGPPLTKRA